MAVIPKRMKTEHGYWSWLKKEEQSLDNIRSMSLREAREFRKLWKQLLRENKKTKEEEKLIKEAENLMQMIFGALIKLKAPAAKVMEQEKAMKKLVEDYKRDRSSNMHEQQTKYKAEHAKLAEDAAELDPIEKRFTPVVRRLSGRFNRLVRVLVKLKKMEGSGEKIINVIEKEWKKMYGQNAKVIENIKTVWGKDLGIDASLTRAASAMTGGGAP